MSLQSALGVGQAGSASAVVTDVENGFHEEHLELQLEEVAEIRRELGAQGWGGGRSGQEETGVGV